ncbi:MAG: DUF2103 domain-containing protein [Patescibacteria group bacterium]
MPHLAGKKYSGRHTTVIDAAVAPLKAVEQLECVTKIVLGLVQQIKGNPVAKTLKIDHVAAGLKVKIRGSKTIQEVYVYTSDRETTAQAMRQAI